jgi:hypothetical protein
MRFRMCAAAFALSLVAAGLVGCGGGSGSGVNNTRSFTGKYGGTFAGTVNGMVDNGTLTGTVASDGSLTGMSHSNAANADGTVTGTISTAGVVASTFVYPGATYTASGTISKTSAGHLIGTLTEFSGTTAIGSFTIDLGPQ